MDHTCLIIVVCFNRPDLIEPQYRTISKFFKKPYKLVIYNNADRTEHRNGIRDICERLGIEHNYVPSRVISNREASISCGQSCQYAISQSGFDHDGPVLLLDSDVFFVKEFNPHEYLVNNDIVGIGQQKEHVFYYTNQLFLFNPTTLPNVHDMDIRCGYIDGILCDVGGYIHHYFVKYPHVRKGGFGQVCSNQFRPEEIICRLSDNEYVRQYLRNEVQLNGGFCEIFGDHYEAIHMRAGSNWVGFTDDMVQKRNSNLFTMIDHICEN